MIEIELIIGTMGIDAIIENKLPRYSQALLSRAGSVLKDFKQGAAKFADLRRPDPLETPKVKYKDYDRLTSRLLEDVEMLEMVDGLASWPTELHPEVLVKLADARVYLSQQIPQVQITGAISAEPLEAPDTDKFRWLWQANIMNDVRVFIDLLLCGAITPLESTLMRTLFPETHDYLLVEVMDHLLDAVVSKKAGSWEGSWKRSALSGFLGVPLASFQDVMQAATGMQEKTAGRPKQMNSVQIAKVNQSDSQALSARTLDQSKL